MENVEHCKDNSKQAMKVRLPSLRWEDIKEKCRQMGEEGYYGDCFMCDQLDLVVKRYRTPEHAPRVTCQISLLQKMEELYGKTVYHQLYQGQVLVGFTMPFIKGKIWDKYISNETSIFVRSSLARVRLILKIQQIMKKIHVRNVCHGDLHFQNILIDLEESKQSLLDPKFQVRVIDFGNGFVMEEGVLVSEGLTGWMPLIPPQVEFSYYKDYNPFGINAYQFARNVLLILLKKGQPALSQTKFPPIYQLEQLQERHEEYPREFWPWLKELLHYDIDRRNKALMQDMSHLEELTKQIYLQKCEDKKK